MLIFRITYNKLGIIKLTHKIAEPFFNAKIKLKFIKSNGNTNIHDQKISVFVAKEIIIYSPYHYKENSFNHKKFSIGISSVAII